MILKVKPTVLSGEIAVPGSKSHTIRAVAVATMAEGVSEIYYPLYSEDTLSSLNAAETLGAQILEKTEKCWKIKGVGGSIIAPQKTIDVGNSGTTLRIFTALAALGNFPVSFDGDDSLRTRVMKPLLDALCDLGVCVNATENKCPLTVQGPLNPVTLLQMNAPSSQFLTALLFALPLAPFDTQIKMTLLNEKPYVEITLDWLRSQNIRFEASEDLMTYTIYGRQSYRAFKRTIPSDFSTATFPLVAALITRSPLTILNLDFSDSQGDKAVFEIAKKMGAQIKTQGNQTVIIPPENLKAIEMDLNATPDALPALSVLAACANGVTTIVNTPQARMKETDRIACMTSELRKMGVSVEDFDDGMRIVGAIGKMQGVEVKGYGDHRIVMALALAGCVAQGETCIDTAEAMSVTYPHFVRDFAKIGAHFSIIQ